MEEENNVFSMDASSVKMWRKVIKVLGYIVYIAGALFATITFSQHISNQFPESPILRFMAYAGAWANFGSLILMPLAKEYWVSGRGMTTFAWIAWAMEVLMVIFNVLAAYGSSWATWWTDLSPASPVMVIFIWGILYYLNPEAKAHQEQVNFYMEAQKDFQAKLRRAMKSKAVQDIMDDGAAQAARQYAERSLNVVIDQTDNAPRQKEPIAESLGLPETIKLGVQTLSRVGESNGKASNPTKQP